jgi:hypothetical protein
VLCGFEKSVTSAACRATARSGGAARRAVSAAGTCACRCAVAGRSSSGGRSACRSSWGRCAARAAFEIGGVPTRALELEARGSELFGKRGFAALGAIRQRCIRNFLQDVLGMTTGPAFVGVNWHGEEGSVKP